MIFADEAGIMMYLVAASIIAAMVVSIYLQVRVQLEATKRGGLDVGIAEKIHQAVMLAEQAGRAAASASKDAKIAAEVAHSAVARSVRNMDTARATAEILAAERTATDKETAGKLDETLKVVRVIHTLNNSAMRQALFAVAELLREKAERTRKTEDMAKADAADADLAEHDAKQGRADKGQ